MVATADNPVYAILSLSLNICRRPVFATYLRIEASGCLPSRCISTNT